MSQYNQDNLNSESIALLMQDLFELLDDIDQVGRRHLGVAHLQYLATLQIYSIVDRILPHVEANICTGASHPLVVEARRRWSYLAEELRLFIQDDDEYHLSNFVTATLSGHGTWSSLGNTPSSSEAAYPSVRCFVADIYNSAYTQNADSQYFTEGVITVPGCPATTIDWDSSCGL